jgi:hypothetical protein
MRKPTKTPDRIAALQANTRIVDLQLQNRLLISTPRRIFTCLSGYLKFGTFYTRKVWAQL